MATPGFERYLCTNKKLRFTLKSKKKKCTGNLRKVAQFYTQTFYKNSLEGSLFVTRKYLFYGVCPAG